MMNKKIMMLALIILSLLTISGVSASEVTCDASNLSGNSDGVLESISDGTFTDLANEIANATDELNLTRDYVYGDGD